MLTTAGTELRFNWVPTLRTDQTSTCHEKNAIRIIKTYFRACSEQATVTFPDKQSIPLDVEKSLTPALLIFRRKVVDLNMMRNVVS